MTRCLLLLLFFILLKKLRSKALNVDWTGIIFSQSQWKIDLTSIWLLLAREKCVFHCGKQVKWKREAYQSKLDFIFNENWQGICRLFIKNMCKRLFCSCLLFICDASFKIHCFFMFGTITSIFSKHTHSKSYLNYSNKIRKITKEFTIINHQSSIYNFANEIKEK